MTMEKEEASFGRRLRGLREAAGLSQEELAGRAGISAKAVGALERGERRRPHPHTLRGLASALGISREDLAAPAMPGEWVARSVPDEAGSGDGRPSLPVPPTELVGREAEVGAVARLLLEEARLVTLTGPGGVGKTRLALEAARAAADGFADGVVFVSLAQLRDSALVLSAVARAFGLREAGEASPREAVRLRLEDKKLLLLLDNFEHVKEAAPEISELLAACPQLRVLVTSRELLRLRGERRFVVGPLVVPDLSRVPEIEEVRASAAVELFSRRAREADPEFAVERQNAAAVAAICRRLDGLPLALELAAALVRMLAPREILARLDRALPLLVGGARDLPERQRAMHATIGWSHDLLEEDEKTAFRRLSVFAGGFTPEEAREVCSGERLEGERMLEVLLSLLDKSLIVAYTTPGAEESRLWMLRTIRSYAHERLAASGEQEWARARHALFFLGVAEEAEPHLERPQRTVWLQRLEAAYDNLRAALSWSRQRPGPEESLRLAGALLLFWFHRGYWSEGRHWFEAALASESGDSEAGARGQVWRAKALYGAGSLACFQGDYATASTLLGNSVDLYRRLDDRHGLAGALSTLGLAALSGGDPAAGRELAEEGVALCRKVGDDFVLARSLAVLGIIAQAGRDPEGARTFYEESARISRRLEDGWLLSLPLRNLAVMVFREGDYDRAAALTRESLVALRALGENFSISRSLEALAAAVALQGEYEHASRLFGAAQALREAIGAPVVTFRRDDYEMGVAAAREGLDEQSFDAAWAEGRQMTAQQAIACALDESPTASTTSG